ncbi:hypothetical protein V5F49_02230 [Xanthobacter sp. V3C-3]|uniref:hypothetical protein n=1 Tax=Xanthobacter lutulentifluminis TaxID=3119935 RepID=UPI00372A3444
MIRFTRAQDPHAGRCSAPEGAFRRVDAGVLARRLAALGLALMACALLAVAPAGPAAAQTMQFLGPPSAPTPPAGPFATPPAQGRPAFAPPGAGQGPGPSGSSREPHAVLPPAPAGKAALGVYARFGADGGAIPRGVVWRVFADQPESTGAFALVAESSDATPVFFLNPGGYIVHVAYGFATSAQRVQMGPVSRRQAFDLPAGALRLNADVDDKPIPAQKLTFDIFEGSFLQGRTSSQPYYRGASAGEVILLPEGTYHVVSTYGDANAVVRADVAVAPGKLTDATVHHRAAQITLKLVKVAHGEAQADTQWTVITPGGDTIKESIGAFPTFVLSEGDYTAIARKDGKNFSRDIKVEAGKNQEVEVLAK